MFMAVVVGVKKSYNRVKNIDIPGYVKLKPVVDIHIKICSFASI